MYSDATPNHTHDHCAPTVCLTLLIMEATSEHPARAYMTSSCMALSSSWFDGWAGRVCLRRAY